MGNCTEIPGLGLSLLSRRRGPPQRAGRTGNVQVLAQPGRQGGRKKLNRTGKYLYQQGLSPSACKYLLTRADTADASQTFSLTHAITRALAAS